MVYEPANAVAFRQRLLTNPGERQDVDYKSSMAFTTNDSFSLNLIRHIQGMANADGGWLVIGFNGTPPTRDSNHTESVCSSYDPTEVSTRVNSSVTRGQRIRLTVYFEAHPETGARHPLIRVEGFVRLPYVCRSDREATDTGERILRQGAVYLRRPSAETSEVSTPKDWEDLINHCVRLRRDEFLTEFRELFERRFLYRAHDRQIVDGEHAFEGFDLRPDARMDSPVSGEVLEQFVGLGVNAALHIRPRRRGTGEVDAHLTVRVVTGERLGGIVAFPYKHDLRWQGA